MSSKLNKTNKSNKSNKKAFTIIEVVLVLAIAGLIFLIVFLALPGLQRSRRDTQRKNDAGRMIADVTNAASNSGTGTPPAHPGSATDITTVLGSTDSYKDPSTGSTYQTTAAVGTAPADSGQVQYAVGYICNGQSATTTDASANNVAIVMPLESGGTYCQSDR